MSTPTPEQVTEILNNINAAYAREAELRNTDHVEFQKVCDVLLQKLTPEDRKICNERFMSLRDSIHDREKKMKELYDTWNRLLPVVQQRSQDL